MRTWQWMLAAAVLGVNAAAAADQQQDALKRLDALMTKVGGYASGGGNTPSRTQSGVDTAYSYLDQFGLARMGDKIRDLDQQVRDLRERDEALAGSLADKLAALEKAAGSDLAQEAEGGYSAKGLGWACQRAPEVTAELNALAKNARQLADNYVAIVASVPIGELDSARILQEKTDRFKTDVSDFLDDIPARQALQDLPALRISFTAQAGGASIVAGMATDVASRASALKSNALNLQDVSVQLVPMLPLYRQSKIEAKQELAALQGILTDWPPKAGALETTLNNSYDSPNTESVLGPAVQKEVGDLVGRAEAAIDRAAKLRQPVDTAVQGCKGTVVADFESARAAVESAMNNATTRINEAYAQRRTEIELADKKAAEVMQTNQATLADLNPKIETLKAKYDATPRDDTARREKILALLHKAQELAKQASDSNIVLQLARQGYQGDLTSVATQAPVATGAVSSKMSALGVGSH